MSAAAASEAAYGGGGAENGGPMQQQPNPESGLYTYNGVAYRNGPYQGAAGGNATAQAAAPAHFPDATGTAEPFKRKRGRPRKYAPDGAVPLAAALPSQTTVGGGNSAADGAGALPPGFSPATEVGGGATHLAADASPTKKMGRPPGSTAKKLQPQRAPLGGAFTGLKPQIFTVQAGEDIASRAMSFSCNGWAICILSANGAVSNVTLHHGDFSGATVTYEGRFEILSLAGSYLLSNSSGLSSRTGGLSVSLAGPDGRVLGGSVAGPLTAASPVQVVIGSFLSAGKEEPDLNFAPGRLLYSALAPSSSPSRGILSESFGGHGSPPNAAASFNTGNHPGFSWK